MAPTCTNCGGTDFVWANELKTGGMTGAGTLSLRPRGEVPLGSRICRTCGHAELFLRDLTLLHQPHTWRPGEFIPIVPKQKPAATSHHGHAAPAPPEAPPVAEAPAAPPPPPPPAPEPSEPTPAAPTPSSEPEASDAEPAPEPAAEEPAAPDAAPAPKAKRTTRRRTSRPKD